MYEAWEPVKSELRFHLVKVDLDEYADNGILWNKLEDAMRGFTAERHIQVPVIKKKKLLEMKYCVEYFKFQKF